MFGGMLGGIQYSAFYKFLVSLGLVIFALGLIVPWLFIHESFDLMIKQADLAQLTELAQGTIQRRQAAIHAASVLVPWISIALCSLGATLSTVGMVQWYRRQPTQDRIEDVSLRKLEAETAQLRKLTPNEQEAKQDAEIRAAAREVAAEAAEESGSESAVAEVAEVAYEFVKPAVSEAYNLTLTKLAQAYVETHTLKANVALGRYEIDGVLEARSVTAVDIIVEIKYRTTRLFDLDAGITQLQHLVHRYEQLTKRRAIGIFIVVYGGAPVPSSYIAKWQSQIRELSNSVTLKFALFPLEELKEMDPKAMKEAIEAS
jgi:hypothetical protein